MNYYEIKNLDNIYKSRLPDSNRNNLNPINNYLQSKYNINNYYNNNKNFMANNDNNSINDYNSINESINNNNNPKKLICDKCDGNHLTDLCPIFKKPRENHPDALRRTYSNICKKCDNHYFIDNVKVIGQPGDGNCLFHSITYGLGNGNAHILRQEIADWINKNPETIISDTPLKDWIFWDSNNTVENYSKKIGISGWGGAIEISACSYLKNVSIQVYEKIGNRFKRISCFNRPNPSKIINILYSGGVHYDALILF